MTISVRPRTRFTSLNAASVVGTSVPMAASAWAGKASSERQP